MPTSLVITPPYATPCVKPSTIAHGLDDLLEIQARERGVHIDAYVGDGEIWISDIHRAAKSLKGNAKLAIRDVQAFARERGLNVALAFWAENGALRKYYTDLGFRIVHDPTEEDLEGPDDHAEARWTPGLDSAAPPA